MKTRGTDYYDPEIVAAWKYNGDQWWSYDNERSTKRKAQYIIDLRLGGGMWWETSGDRDNDLIGVLADQLRNGQPGDVIDPTDPTDPTDPGTPSGAAA